MLRFVDLRDKALDASGLPLHYRLFLQAHTGGAAGDGTLRELPQRTLRTIKQEFLKEQRWRDNFEDFRERARQDLNSDDPNKVAYAQNYLDKFDHTQARASDAGFSEFGTISLYNSGDPEAHLGLGMIGLYQDSKGNVLIKDTWKVDNPDKRKEDGRIYDLVEGGHVATQLHDAATRFGTYKDIPIEVRLTKEQWDAIEPGGPSSEYSLYGLTKTRNDLRKDTQDNLRFVDKP